MLKPKKPLFITSLIPFLLIFMIQVGDKPKDRDRVAKIMRSKSVGSVSEPICDATYWKGKLYLAPYLRNKKCRVHIVDTVTNNITTIFPRDRIVESVYRIWTDPKRCYLYLQTEQPPLFCRSLDGLNWELVKEYARNGWGVLGCTTSNGKMFRGYSSPNMDTAIWIYENHRWRRFPTLGKRIVWVIEYFKGGYYAGTSPTVGYKGRYIGKIYRYRNGKWVPVMGDGIRRRIGAVICGLATQNGLFFGTGNPEEVILLHHGSWKVYHFYNEQEISKIWQDSLGRIFIGVVTKKRMMIMQWVEGNWVKIYQIKAKPGRWDVLGGTEGQLMYVVYRDGDETKILFLDYR